MEYQVWLNGEFMPRSEAKLGLTDRGLRLGDVVFDTSRTFNGKVFRLEDHIDRLYRSLTYVRIDPGMTKDEMIDITLDVVQRNESIRETGDDYMVTQFVTRGEGGRSALALKPNIVVWIDPLDHARMAPLYSDGAHVVIPKIRSYPSDALDPKIKHYSRLNFVLAELEATDVDPEAFPVLTDARGNLTESIGSNFFIVTDGVIRTPTDRSILQGVSRLDIFDLAKGLGIPVSEEDLQPYDAYTADEAFLTNTIYCALPVSRIDNRSLGSEVPGPVVQRILAAWSETVGVDIVDQALHQAGSKA
jgi:branched-chain amino acid aminotransferase